MVESPNQDRISLLREMTAADPEDGLGWQMLGGELLRAGQYADAAEALGQAARLTPELAAIWKQLGDAQRKSGNSEQARAAYEQAISVAESTGDLQAAKEARALLTKL